MSNQMIGFIGLGKMGRPMATHVAAAHPGLLVFDVVTPADGWPVGSTAATSAAHVAQSVDVAILSLPDGIAAAAVVTELIAASNRRLRCIIDTSTVGVEASRTIASAARTVDVDYVDAPVSGGVAGAQAARLTAMWAADAAISAVVEPLLDTFCAKTFRVGDEAGMAQATKLANNYLSGIAIAASCEAIALAAAHGVDPEVAVAVINESTGRNTATTDKFPQQVFTGQFASGFSSSLLLKDLQLCDDAAVDAGTGWALGSYLVETWARFEAAHPGSDVTLMYRSVTASDPNAPSAKER